MSVSPASPAPASSHDRAVILILMASAFVVILNETIMNVALPRLMAELQIEARTAQWLSTAFMLTMAVVIPTTGFLLQRLQTRTVFLTAMTLFCVGTLLAAVATGFPPLLLGRIIQAAGTAIMMPLLITTILTVVPPERRGVVMGSVSVVMSVAPAIGPTLAGLILALGSWRALFLFMFPVALAALGYGVRQLRNLGTPQPMTLDVLSVALSGAGFGGLVYALSRAGELTQLPVAGALVVGGVSLALFVQRQLRLQRNGNPLLDLRPFQAPMFTLGVLLIMVAMTSLFGGALLLPFYLQNVRGLSSLQTGLLLLPGGLLMGLMAPTVGRLYDRHGPLWLSVVGAGLLTVATAGMTQMTATTPVTALLALHVTLGIGLGFLFTPVFTNALAPLPPQLYTHGSAILSTLQQVAGAAGTALLVTVMASRAAQLVEAGTPAQVAQGAGLQAAFVVATAISALALIMALFLRRTQLHSLAAPPVDSDTVVVAAQ